MKANNIVLYYSCLIPFCAIIGVCLIAFDPRNKIEVKKFDKIVRVFVHDTNHVSFFALKNETEIEHLSYHCRNIRYITDVEPDDSMWAEVKSPLHQEDWKLGTKEVNIHIHSLQDLSAYEQTTSDNREQVKVVE